MVRALPQYSEPDFIFKLDIMFPECIMLLAAAYFTFFIFFCCRARSFTLRNLCAQMLEREDAIEASEEDNSNAQDPKEKAREKARERTALRQRWKVHV